MNIPKGKLLIIGGAESKGNEEDNNLIMSVNNKEFLTMEILKHLKPKKSGNHIIEMITTASQMPDNMKSRYTQVFQEIGFKEINIMHMDEKSESRDPDFVERIKAAHAVFFTGGDQFRLATIMGCTEVISAIYKKYKDDPSFIVAGTSAGAMAMTKIMIERGQTQEAMIKGDLKVTSGLGFLDHCIIDTHFIKRGRIGRLAQAIITNPSSVGIGLGEDSALIILNGNEMECIGSGMVIIIDCQDIGKTNIYFEEEGKPLFAENITMHILTNGNSFHLKDRKFIIKEEDQKKVNERVS